MAKTIAVAEQQTSGLDRLKSQPERLMTFLSDVRAEMRKVVAPTRKEVQATTSVVIITVFIFGLFFFVVDLIFSRALHELLTRAGGAQ